MDEPDLGKAGSGRSQELGHSRASSVTSVGSGSGRFEYFGWVYHLGVNKIGHEYCHLRFLFIRGKHVLMYKRDPHENQGIKPIRKGVVGPTLMIEELGRRKVNSGGAGGDIYALRFYNRWDETKKGEIACATAGEVQKWMEAFDQAKQQAEYELSRVGSARNHLNSDDEIDLDGHRPRVRKYARGLKRLIKIGEGPENLLRQSSLLVSDMGRDGYFENDVGDAVEAYEWKCVRAINGVRIFQDVAETDRGKGVIVKAVGVIDASADTAFEVLMNIERRQRYEWDMLTGDLEMIDSCDGHHDVVYGTFSPMYLSRWESKRDFIFSRQWFHGQDGTYTILQSPAVHKKKPRISGYSRTKLNPSTWEIKDLNTSMETDTPRCLVTQMLEIPSVGWWKWKKNHFSKFEKSIPYALLCQVAGLKEYIASNPSLKLKSAASIIQSKIPHVSVSSGESEPEGIHDEFYDALSGDSSSSDEESDTETEHKDMKMKLKNVAWAITSLALKRTLSDANRELDPKAAPFKIDPSQFNGSLRNARDDADTDCWTSPNGTGFMIRGKTYLKDSSKVTGQEPLLKLIAVDWFKVDKSMDRIALHPKCLMQSEAGKKLPFVLVVNLQVPATPNYSLVLYYSSDRPVKPNSLLAKFVDGSDMFRNARFKLIPSIVDGYWMVKRAVGSKACLLGKAVSCKYLRQDNFLEIDVDIGSSSVARSIIGLVLGYVTSIVVDLAILIEAKEEEELPEYILGTVRLNRLKIDSAVKLEA